MNACLLQYLSVLVASLQTAYTRGLFRHVLIRIFKTGVTYFYVHGGFDFRMPEVNPPLPPSH
jgi:hypothetical protein